MKRASSLVLLAMIFVSVIAFVPQARSQALPEVRLGSHYYLNRYGFAVENVTVSFKNNSTQTMQAQNVVIGFGSLGPMIASYGLKGNGFTATMSGGDISIVGSGASVTANNSTEFVLSVVLQGVVTKSSNGSVVVTVLTSPSLNVPLAGYTLSVGMPTGTSLTAAPSSMRTSSSSSNTTYWRTGSSASSLAVSTSQRVLRVGSTSDFHPLTIYQASRIVSVGPDGNPLVTDSFTLVNNGTTSLSTLYVSPLITSGSRITIQPAVEPRLLSPTTIIVTGGAIDLTNARVGNPILPGAQFRLAYQYSPSSKYYAVSGGVVSVNVPDSPPIAGFIGSYSISASLPAGVRLVSGQPTTLLNVGPFQGGVSKFSYALNVGWAIDDGVPVASILFVLLLGGLYVSKVTTSEEAEEEEESSTETASVMILAFEEKTSLINQIWPEIKSADPNTLNRAFFDEIRGRLDSFRTRALQRLNEVKQKSTTQRFTDILAQMQATEREVDRASKDTLNLYEQYYTKRMRKEVFDRLLPQYTKRLEKALNQLSDELHAVQREAKLL